MISHVGPVYNRDWYEFQDGGESQHICLYILKTSWLPSKKESNTLGGKILKILNFKDRGILKFGVFFSQFLTLGQSLIIIFQLS